MLDKNRMAESFIRNLAAQSELELTKDMSTLNYTLVYKGKKTNITLNFEAFKDLRSYNGLDIEVELIHAAVQELASQYDLTKEEQGCCRAAIAVSLGEQSNDNSN